MISPEVTCLLYTYQQPPTQVLDPLSREVIIKQGLQMRGRIGNFPSPNPQNPHYVSKPEHRTLSHKL